MLLTVIRHGQSFTNLKTWHTLKNLDAGLTETGQQQAQALHDWFIANETVADVLITSTLKRTLETTAILQPALKLEPIPDHRIREIPTVSPSGQPLDGENFGREYASDWANKAPFVPRCSDIEGAESWMHFRTRVGQFMDDMVAAYHGQRVYVVAHGGVISAIFDNIFNVGPYRRADVHNYNTSWSRFEYRNKHDREQWLLWEHNRTDHLRDAGLL